MSKGKLTMPSISREDRREIKRDRRRERNRKRTGSYEVNAFDQVPIIRDYQPNKVDYHVQAKTETQGHYLLSIDSNVVTFSIGPAGTGKTHCAVAKGCEYLESGKVDRLILTRPLMDAEGDKVGALPGELNEKFDPYIMPMRQLLDQFLGKSKVEAYIKAGKIVPMPLAFCRGLTFDRSFIIASEMQNSSPITMKLILSRIGKWSKIVLDGDIRQKDIKGKSGLEDAIVRLHGVDDVNIIEFNNEDIVRSDIVRFILQRYEN